MSKLLPGIQNIQLPKSSSLLSDRLRDMIRRGELTIGDMLPSERNLVTETGLSRGSVREALRTLEAEGLLETVRGRSGGTRVAAPQRGALTRSVELFVRANSVSPTALLDCRAAVEPMLARLAAKHRTDEEMEELETLHQRFKDAIEELPKYRAINYRWHQRIAYSSRNEPLIALIDAILTAALEASTYDRVTTPENRRIAIAGHDRVMTALRVRDAEGAAAAMEEHLMSYSKAAQKIIG